MAEFKVEVDDYVYRVTFNAVDLFMATPLGCHAGSLGNVAGYISFRDDLSREQRIGRFSVLDASTSKLLQDADVHRKLMDWMVANAARAFGGWTKAGTTYLQKSHWILSAPWKKVFPTQSPFEMSTQSLMDLIAQFCDAEPAKYGQYVMTKGTDCSAHENNSGMPCTRTMIWHPPYVGYAETELVTTATGAYKPIPPPQPLKVVPPPVVKAKVKKSKELPPRPKRKEFVVTTALPKKQGPVPRQRYARAA